MWNCSFANPAMGVSTDRRYSEQTYAKYYANFNETITNKTLQSKSDGRGMRGTSLSGPGSNAEETVGVRAALPALLALLGVRSIIDAPCGDFNYMREVLSAPLTPSRITYTGLDIVASLAAQLQDKFASDQRGNAKRHRISFAQFDITQVNWPFLTSLNPTPTDNSG